MATPSAPTTNGFHYTDWEDRYYHVDQVLDSPGPRTDPDSFMAGDGVSALSLSNSLYPIRGFFRSRTFFGRSARFLLSARVG
jgi:hypothetical protein